MLYAESVLFDILLQFGSCTILLDCLVDFLRFARFIVGLAKKGCLAAVMNLVIFI